MSVMYVVQVEPYYGSQYKPRLGALKSGKALNHALQEADELMKLTPLQRLEECVFKKSSKSSVVNVMPTSGEVVCNVLTPEMLESAHSSPEFSLSTVHCIVIHVRTCRTDQKVICSTSE